MKRQVFLLFLLMLSFAGFSQRNYWQQQVNYIIDVRLNDSAHTLDGFEKIEYINNSPDTLYYIWFHLWPNAYKNDKTAFSDQLLENGRTDFYFSDNSQRGYINRLDFRVEGVSAKTEDYPQHIDIIKVNLPQPLAPGNKVQLTTPFHVQLPYNFSRGGHVGNSYQITQWYPKPAVYDSKGWHPIPYLDQGEFYSEFGDFDVRITLPNAYVLAATGELQSEEHSIPKNKTLRYVQTKVHDFAWFADRDFAVKQDTLQLPSGRVIKVASYCYRSNVDRGWSKSVQFIKDALLFRSKILGEYPYNVASVVQSNTDYGGMEYPTITRLDAPNEKELDIVIEHELGHNWFQGILASNERRYPWMDEGMNSYYDDRYTAAKYGKAGLGMFDMLKFGKGIAKKLPKDENMFMQDLVNAAKKDQPMNTPSEAFNNYNYNVISYLRTASLLHSMEEYAGRNRFDSAMKAYYEQWKFKHPYPEDFFKVMEAETGKNLAEYRSYINVKEIRPVFEPNRKPKLTAFFSVHDYKKYHYIGVLPAIGRNKYDGIMLGLGIHNYSLPLNRFRFAVFPLYATNSKQFTGIGKVSYIWLPDKKIYSVQAGLIGSKFSMLAAK
ncbi:MAG TPA: M1 family metallopeptidase, partial [Ferruginibacter sp.]|nr:M1 family metallopeptidase [Ferruginibacter sp.]